MSLTGVFKATFAASPHRAPRSAAAAFLAALLVSACASGPSEPDALIADPYQDTNRSIHSFNKGVDSAVLRPLAQGYDAITPALIKHLLSNELNHLRMPGIFVNRVLQGDAEEAGAAFGRFALNTTIGALGLLDPATEFGLPYEPTDFGVTLAVWGVDEGVYVELPFFGPSTSRHAVGRVVDFALDPSILITTGAVEVGTAIAAANTARTPVDIVNARHENAELIDEVLYESEDSYLTARTGYVQNRRARVSGGETDTEALPDLFD